MSDRSSWSDFGGRVDSHSMSSVGSIEHLYLPPSLRYFVPKSIDGRHPGAHACLEYDLVEAKRPAMVVDLGAGNAQSFCVLCQSMKDHDVDGLAYGVDLWESDKQREAEGATPWTTINNFVHTHFRGFAYLLKSTPEQTLLHFADRSVGLLRVDLGRTERPLGALLHAWTPKLEPGGVLLCSGLSERKRALEEWQARYPASWVLAGDGGLGVAVHGRGASSAAPDLFRWLSDETDGVRERIGSFYEHAALHLSLKIEVLGHGDVLFRKRPDI